MTTTANMPILRMRFPSTLGSCVVNQLAVPEARWTSSKRKPSVAARALQAEDPAIPGMTVAANGEKVLRRPRDLDDFAAMWRSYQPAARCTGVVLLRSPAM